MLTVRFVARTVQYAPEEGDSSGLKYAPLDSSCSGNASSKGSGINAGAAAFVPASAAMPPPQSMSTAAAAFVPRSSPDNQQGIFPSKEIPDSAVTVDG